MEAKEFWTKVNKGYVKGWAKHYPRVSAGRPSRKASPRRAIYEAAMKELGAHPKGLLIGDRNTEIDEMGGSYSLKSFCREQGEMLMELTKRHAEDDHEGTMVDFACNCCHRIRLLAREEDFIAWVKEEVRDYDPSLYDETPGAPTIDDDDNNDDDDGEDGEGAEDDDEDDDDVGPSKPFFLAFRHFLIRDVCVIMDSRDFVNPEMAYAALGTQEWYMHYFATRAEAVEWLDVMPLVASARQPVAIPAHIKVSL